MALRVPFTRRWVTLSAVGAAIAAASVACAGRWLVAWRNRRKYSGLKDVVSFSSRMMAAQRALENTRPDRLFEDPLAEVLAGQQAMERARERGKATEESRRDGAPARKGIDGRIAIRAKYFDDAILHALKDSRLRQVVVLGTGMDTRPWRLPVPPGVVWFDVDRPDVIAAKVHELHEARAQTSAANRSDGSSPLCYPCRVDRYCPVATDLSAPTSLQHSLAAAGFDPLVPTVWLGEGLLMYLPEAGVLGLLRQAAALSSRGSVALFSMVSEGAVKKAQQSGSELTSTWLWGLPEGQEGVKFLLSSSWRTHLLHQIGTPAASYGRGLVEPDPPNTPDALRTLYWQGYLA
mmetsp:Transcript_22065/g.61234  ORF Transcript_22065/g.61234 Transcript_22065/m.61234 type:complete len:348 (-) Transcript_22065:109-1152(-)